LLLTKAIIFLFYSCFCYNKSRKEDERNTETDIESKQQQHHQLSTIHKIDQQQQYQHPQHNSSSLGKDSEQRPQPEAAAAMQCY
jgi:hypothetical protein